MDNPDVTSYFLSLSLSLSPTVDFSSYAKKELILNEANFALMLLLARLLVKMNGKKEVTN